MNEFDQTIIPMGCDLLALRDLLLACNSKMYYGKANHAEAMRLLDTINCKANEVTEERDAAVEDLNGLSRNLHPCDYCEYDSSYVKYGPCRSCEDQSGFE
ncbi:hypothetical protein FACS1894184_20260 [Clostridia bacterium]|nr:hypothetical protein FACS1894184_20260 [Clostridia bacterium]